MNVLVVQKMIVQILAVMDVKLIHTEQTEKQLEMHMYYFMKEKIKHLL